MNYEVKEKKFFELKNIKKVLKFDYNLRHVETTFDLEKYVLELVLLYEDINEEKIEEEIELPIEFNTSMTEQLSADVKDIDIKTIVGNGVEICFEFLIKIDNINSTEKEEEKQEIKEIYQQELEEKLQLRDEEVEDKKEEIALNIGCDENDSFLNLKTDFIRCKVINLDDNNLDKLSKKYNLSMDYLFNLKKSNNKLIVYDKD